MLSLDLLNGKEGENNQYSWVDFYMSDINKKRIGFEEQKQVEIRRQALNDLERRKEKAKKSIIEENIRHSILKKERKERAEFVDREAELFSKSILKTLNKFEDEEIPNIIVRTLNSEERFNQIVEIYTSNCGMALNNFDTKWIVREALNKSMRTVKKRIEVKHCEFSRVVPVKTMTL